MFEVSGIIDSTKSAYLFVLPSASLVRFILFDPFAISLSLYFFS
jgi:hypothetical protein